MTTSYEKLTEERKCLPIYSYRDSLLEAIDKHQIIVVTGASGCGKSTQIPQYLYEAGYTKYGKIGCTQSRGDSAVSVADRVSQEMGLKLGDEVGYCIKFKDCTSEKTILKYITDEMLVHELLNESTLASYSVLIVDDATERTLSTDILFGLLKDIAKSRPNLKLLISCATFSTLKFSEYFDINDQSTPVFKIPSRQFRVEIHYLKEPKLDYLPLAVEFVFEIHVKQPRGDIVLFLTNQEEIETVVKILKNRAHEIISIPELIICPVYSNQVLEPTPDGARKVILATDISETLLIDSVKYVIDPGLASMKYYNPSTGRESVISTEISKSLANQRATQASRTGHGKCFRLYTTNSFFNERNDTTFPNIKRANLLNLVFTLKSHGINDLLKFDFMDPPPTKTLLTAQDLLVALGALDKHGDLTTMGRKMANFPLDSMLSKMIIASEKYKCSDDIITIAAMLSVGNPIFENASLNICIGNVGDHISLLKVYNTWKETNFSTQWCDENSIQVKSLERARDIKDQLKVILEKVEIKLTSNPHDLEAIKKAIISGYFPNLARLQNDGSYKTVKHSQDVYIHPSSGLAKVLPRLVVYHELVVTSKAHMQQVNEVKHEWLQEISPHYYGLKELEDLQLKD